MNFPGADADGLAIGGCVHDDHDHDDDRGHEREPMGASRSTPDARER